MAFVYVSGWVQPVADAPQTYHAPCEAQIAFASQKKSLRAGETAMVIESAVIAAAKLSLLSPNADLFAAAEFLKKLGFSNGQINYVMDKKDASPRLRVSFPFAIELNSTKERSTQVQPCEILFTYTAFRSSVGRVTVSREAAKYLSQSKPIYCRPAGLEATPWSKAEILKVTSNVLMSHVRVDLALPAVPQLENGQAIEVRFQAPGLAQDIRENAIVLIETGSQSPPPASLDAIGADWPYKSPPRGLAGGYLPLVTTPKPKSQGTVAAPEGARFAFPLADRNKIFLISKMQKRPRSPVIFSDERWASTHISTAVVDQETQSNDIVVYAKLELHLGGNEAAIKASVQGTFHMQSRAPYSLVPPNTVIGSIELPATLIALQELFLNSKPGGTDHKVAADELRAAGLSEADLNLIRTEKSLLLQIPVVARRGGLVGDTPVGSGEIVDRGTPILTLIPATQHVVICHLDRETFERMPRSVRLEVAIDRNPFEIGFDRWERLEPTVFGATVENETTAKLIKVAFWLRWRDQITLNAKPVEIGRMLKIRLIDAFSDRKVLCVPDDCVTTVGKSAEVLVHTGGGVLTPAPVQVGTRFDTKVEIASGLVAGEQVVRALSELRRDDEAIGATMLGFWASDEHEV